MDGMTPYQNEMQRCFDGQPTAVRQVLRSLPDTLADFRARFGGKRPKTVVLLGIGSSYHALHMARAFGQALLGVPVLAQTPEQLDWLHPAMQESLLVIAASQSGTSTNVLARMRELKAFHIPTAAVTQALDSPVAQLADCVLPLDMPEEKAGPKTMGVMDTAIITAFALCALCDQSGQATATLAKQGEAFAQRLESNLPIVKEYVAKRAEALKGHPAWIVVGQKALCAPAGESALKLVETIRTPVALYELEEVVHGPCACFSRQTALLLLGSEWEERARPVALRNLCEASGGTAYSVVAIEGATEADGNQLLLSTPKHPLYAALMLLLPAQAISAWIPPVMGIDLDAHHENQWTAVLAGHL